MQSNKKTSLTVSSAVIVIILFATILLLAQRYVASKTTFVPNSTSQQTELDEWHSLPAEDDSPQPRSPFKQKALVKTTQNGNTTETTTISKREVDLTEEDEQKYYGNHPEYKGWNAAYSANELYRYPDPWGYHSFWDHLLSDDLGETTRSVVSLSISPGSAKSEYFDHRRILDAEIGYVVPSLNQKLVKVAELKTIDGRKAVKLRQVEESTGIVTVEYFIDQPINPETLTHIYGNPMYPEVIQANEATLDEIIRSFVFVPNE